MEGARHFVRISVCLKKCTQMYRSSASSKISFHGLPSKSKRPGVRKKRCRYHHN